MGENEKSVRITEDSVINLFELKSSRFLILPQLRLIFVGIHEKHPLRLRSDETTTPTSNNTAIPNTADDDEVDGFMNRSASPRITQDLDGGDSRQRYQYQQQSFGDEFECLGRPCHEEEKVEKYEMSDRRLLLGRIFGVDINVVLLVVVACHPNRAGKAWTWR